MDPALGKSILWQVLNIWIKPEIERRKKVSKLDRGFELRSAQIIFSLDRNCTKIRLNDEVKAEIVAISKRAIKKGDIVLEDDLEKIKKINLTDDDKNCAHVTILKFKNRWIISVDFRYNKARVKEHIKASKEFYESAKTNLKKKLLRPFFENAFASAELSAKSILLLLPDKEIMYGTFHGERKKRFRGWAELGNVPKEYSKILDKLTSIRPSARYLASTEYKKIKPEPILKSLKEMIKFAENGVR